MSIILTCLFISLTIGVYTLSRIVGRKFPSPFTTPVFFSTTILIALLLISDVPYEQYIPASNVMTKLLGPATVALAVPLYKYRKLIIKHSASAGLGLVLGSTATILSIIFIAKLFHLTDGLIKSLSIKSATAPIAVEIAKIIYADLSLTAAFVVLTGTIIGMAGPWFLNITNISDPISRGLSMGTIAHGQGTAEIAREGHLQGAMAGLAMALAAIFTAIIIPVIIQLLT